MREDAGGGPYCVMKSDTETTNGKQQNEREIRTLQLFSIRLISSRVRLGNQQPVGFWPSNYSTQVTMRHSFLKVS